jgi:uncharacterized repeat protein (TIGR01451 family)
MKTPTPRPRSHRTNLSSLTRVAAFVALVALIAIPLFSSSFASSSEAQLTRSFQKADGNLSGLVGPQRVGARTQTELFKNPSALSLFALAFPQAPPPPESIATFTYANGACTTTVATQFATGDTVCAKAENGQYSSPRKIYWVNPDGAVVQIDSISATNPGATRVVAAVGRWSVYLVDGADGSARALTYFLVSDPQRPTVDLSVFKDAGNDTFTAGGIVSYRVIARNNGPDDAASVTLTEDTPNNTTQLVNSPSQDSGPTFSCTAGSPTVCTIASFPAGSSASFTFFYQVAAGTPAGTVISNTVTITSSTEELFPSDNTWSTQYKVVAAAGGGTNTCSVGCPDDIIVQANTTQSGVDGAIVHFSPPSGNEECGPITTNHCNDCFFPEGTTTVTGSAATGESCSFTVQVTAAAGNAATISCPPNKTGTANNDCEAVVNVGTATATGQNVTISSSRSDGRPLSDPYPAGVTTITWTATTHDSAGDDTGNASCQQTVTVDDITPPTITATDQTVSANANCQAVVPDYTNSVSDNCACAANDDSQDCVGQHVITLTQDPAAGTIVGIGPHTIHLTANDGSSNNNGAGNTTQKDITFTVSDTTAPTVTAPADSSASADASCQAAVPNYTANSTASDNCDSSVTLTQSPAAGTMVGAGPHTVTVTGTDDAGNQGTDTVVFTVNDTTAPSVTAPADSSASADASCLAPVPDYTANSTASDSCDSSVTLTQSPAAGTLVTIGAHTVTVTGTDDAGNHSSDDVVFTVNDTTAPTVTAPADSSASANASCQAPVPNYVANSTASDNCDNSVTLTQSPAAGTMVGKGPHTVTVTGTDDAGNQGTDTVVFTVNDTTAPVITCPGNITRSNDPGVCSASINPGTATATDNCDSPTVTGTRSDNQPLTAPYPVGTTTITWTATDGSNNSSSCAQTITVNDTEAPTITCPSSITIESTCPTGAVGTYTAPTGSDNCPGAVTTRTAGGASGSVFPIGTTTVTYTVNDAHGNSTSCSFTVTVLTPQAVLQNLRNSVNASSLNGTQKNGLLAKLDAAIDGLNTGHTTVACNKLDAFINSVQTLISHGDISAAQGNAWINSANHVRNTIGCTNNPCT